MHIVPKEYLLSLLPVHVEEANRQQQKKNLSFGAQLPYILVCFLVSQLSRNEVLVLIGSGVVENVHS